MPEDEPLSFAQAAKQEAIRDLRSPWARRARIGLYMALTGFATLAVTWAGARWFGTPDGPVVGIPADTDGAR